MNTKAGITEFRAGKGVSEVEQKVGVGASVSITNSEDSHSVFTYLSFGRFECKPEGRKQLLPHPGFINRAPVCNKRASSVSCDTTWSGSELLICARESHLPPELISFHPKAKKLEISVNLCGLIPGKCRLPRGRFGPWKMALGTPFPPLSIPGSLGARVQWDSVNIFTLQMGTLRAILGEKKRFPQDRMPNGNARSHVSSGLSETPHPKWGPTGSRVKACIVNWRVFSACRRQASPSPSFGKIVLTSTPRSPRRCGGALDFGFLTRGTRTLSSLWLEGEP